MDRNDPSAQEIIRLFQAKNRGLQRLLELGTKFLARWDAAEQTAESRGEALTRFQARRDSAFRALEHCDRRIGAALAALPNEARTPKMLEESRRALAAKDRLLQALIARDQEIMTRLESEKGRVLEELVDARRGQSLVSKFKSTWVPDSGEGLDQKL